MVPRPLFVNRHCLGHPEPLGRVKGVLGAAGQKLTQMMFVLESLGCGRGHMSVDHCRVWMFFDEFLAVAADRFRERESCVPGLPIKEFVS